MKKLSAGFGFVFAFIVLFGSPVPAFASDRHHHGDRHGHHRNHSFFSVDLSLWPGRYYYREPIYYTTPSYVVVAPSSYQPVIVNGTTYYVNNGSYYLYTGYGYELVSPPLVVQAVPAPVQVTIATNTSSEDSFVVNIPNSKGGYTAVTIKRAGQGFVGPQGEFYSEFPKIKQLTAMYSK